MVKLWNRRRTYQDEADKVVRLPDAGPGMHGGADSSMSAEFLAVVRGEVGSAISPVEARDAVAAGCAATHSLRHGGVPVDVPPVTADLAAHFAA